MGYLEIKYNKPIIDRVLDFIFYKYGYMYVKPYEGTFIYEGKNLPYFHHPYNFTWVNERQIEIQIFTDIVNKNLDKDILEVGNVMNHYTYFKHDVVDKYEKVHGVINQDIVDYKPNKRYDLIFSISVFEHIGYIEQEPYNDNKIISALIHAESLLKDGGLLVLSFSLGFNDNADKKLIKEKKVAFDKTLFYKRVDGKDWYNCKEDELNYIYYSDRYTRISRELFIGFIQK
jgi:hypothetical protein